MVRQKRSRLNIANVSRSNDSAKKIILVVAIALVLLVSGLAYFSFRGDSSSASLFNSSIMKSEKSRDLWKVDDKRELLKATDELIDKGNTELPLYLRKGDKLYINLSSEDGMTVSLWNYDKGSSVKDFGQSQRFTSEFDVPVSAIYYLLLKSNSKQYYSCSIEKSSASYEDFQESARVSKVIVNEGVSEKDSRAVKFQVMESTSLFYEPKQITLKKLFHFSGSTRSVVPVKIPKGVSEVICRIRVSSSRNSRVGDGELHKDVNDKISRFIDNFSLKRQTARMIFDDLERPHTEHDYTVDLYVFNEQKWARGFQTGDYDCKWQKHYDVASSIIGTQSCNDLISVNGRNIIYLGFEGTHSFDDTYLWLECEFMKPVVRYSRIDYKRQL